MTNKPKHRISTLGSRVTSIISVALVLLIMGILGVIGIITASLSESLRENINLTVKLDPTVDSSEAATIGAVIDDAGFAASSIYRSADDVYNEELALNPEIAEFGENPFAPEYEITLKPAYVCPDSVDIITARLQRLNYVDEVVSPTEAISSINNVLQKSAIVLMIIGAVLLIISVALIFNTVSLSIYSRRFTIHTMQLVGATWGFIRRPFVRSAMLSGLISAIISSAVLYGLLLYARSTGIELFTIPQPAQLLALFGVLVLIGLVINGVSAYLATTKFLKATYDKLYK